MKGYHNAYPGEQYERVSKVPLALHDASYHMHNQRRIGDVDEHVNGFPRGWSQVAEPEVVACGRKKEKDEECQCSECLEREGRNG